MLTTCRIGKFYYFIYIKQYISKSQKLKDTFFEWLNLLQGYSQRMRLQRQATARTLLSYINSFKSSLQSRSLCVPLYYFKNRILCTFSTR